MPRLAAANNKQLCLFADIRGSSEGGFDEIHDFVASSEKILTRHHGILNKFVADSIMAIFFDIPTISGTAAERALNATVEMKQYLEEFNLKKNITLRMGFGINTGVIARRGEYTVLGDAVNVAAHLGDASRIGEILVGSETHRLTENLFAYEARNPLMKKGQMDPVPVYQMTGKGLPVHISNQLPRDCFATIPLAPRRLPPSAKARDYHELGAMLLST